MWTKQNIRTALQFLFGVLFIWAGASKLANPLEFLSSIFAYELPLPTYLLKATAVVLPWIELICGLMLLAGLWAHSALLLVSSLVVLFVLATGQAWLRGLDISCGCFNLAIFNLSAANSAFVRFIESPGFAFVRNLVFLSGLVWLIRGNFIEQSRPNPSALKSGKKNGGKTGGKVLRAAV